MRLKGRKIERLVDLSSKETGLTQEILSAHQTVRILVMRNQKGKKIKNFSFSERIAFSFCNISHQLFQQLLHNERIPTDYFNSTVRSLKCTTVHTVQ